MSFQFWDLLQDTPRCEGAGLGRDCERDALSNLHPLQHTPLKKRKKKKHIFSAFWHSNMKHIQDLLSLLGPDIPHSSDPSKLLLGIWTCCCRGITRSGDTFTHFFSHSVTYLTRTETLSLVPHRCTFFPLPFMIHAEQTAPFILSP